VHSNSYFLFILFNFVALNEIEFVMLNHGSMFSTISEPLACSVSSDFGHSCLICVCVCVCEIERRMCVMLNGIMKLC